MDFDPVDTRPVDAGQPVLNDPPQPGDMATEPALTVGELFANKTLIQPVISASVAIVAQVLNMTVSDDLVSNITLLVTFPAIAYTAYSAQTGQANSARKQAAATREVVYSPASVQHIATNAATTGEATVAPPPVDGMPDRQPLPPVKPGL